MTRSRLFLPLVCTGLLACGEGRPPVGQEVIGPSGGTITVDDNSAVLQVPAGAVAQEVEITISRPGDGALPKGAMAGTLVEIGPPGLKFAKPVTLTVTYDGAKLPQADTSWLRMIQLLDGEKLGATLLVGHDPAASALSAMLTTSGKYALADLKLANATIETKQQKITDVDVLFVVDNSNSMAEEQKNLAQNFPKLIQKLDQAQLGYRVGVVSTDLGAGNYNIPSCETAGGDAGKLRSAPMVAGCVPPTDPWIEKIGTATNVPGGDVSGAFSCIAQVGTGGCGFENTLEAARQALSPGVNPGFLRQNAALAVVLLTDEDDCSAAKPGLYDTSQQSLTDPLGPLSSFRCFEFGVSCDINDRTQPGPRQNCVPTAGWLHGVAAYEQFFKQLKPAGRVVLAAIAGPAEPVVVGLDANTPSVKPSCQSVNGSAAPAIRIKALVDAFGANGHFNTGTDASGNTVPVGICDSDFSPALSFVGDLVTQQALTSWCLPYDPVDTNPLTTEVEADCVVMAKQAGQIPACKPGASGPCYSLLASQSCSGSTSVLRVENIDPADLGDEVWAICLVL
jgi:hypothetical protein